ncbi:MAG: TetR family transcriptional regulator [Cellvibrionaceae bacterium]|nr:TetR family transcriptional regulator [Cellvibrionaceae bacterium]
MPRSKSHSRNTLVGNAMLQFWEHGYEATSVGNLVSATGVNRGALYADFGGKRELFLACLSHFQDAAVTPVFADVEAEDAGLAAIEAYLNDGVTEIQKFGLPARGCLMGNTLTELGPHDDEIAKIVNTHYDRLSDGFARALANEIDMSPSGAEIKELAGFLAVSAQGLWAYARAIDNINDLKKKVRLLIELVKLKLTAMSDNTGSKRTGATA